MTDSGASRIFVFDAYGTLFDVHSAAARYAGEIGPVWERLSEIWRTKQLEYTWIYAATGRRATFWELTERGLDYAIAATENTLKQTKFSLPEAIALLDGLDIILENPTS